MSDSALQRCSCEKGVLKIWSKFTGEHSCQCAISIKLLCIFSEHLFLRTPLDGCFWDVNIFRKPRNNFRILYKDAKFSENILIDLIEKKKKNRYLNVLVIINWFLKKNLNILLIIFSNKSQKIILPPTQTFNHCCR